MQNPMHPFVNGESCPQAKYQDSDDETPEIQFLAIAKRMPIIRWQAGTIHAVKQEDLEMFGRAVFASAFFSWPFVVRRCVASGPAPPNRILPP